jgi:hypothetical protein
MTGEVILNFGIKTLRTVCKAFLLYLTAVLYLSVQIFRIMAIIG